MARFESPAYAGLDPARDRHRRDARGGDLRAAFRAALPAAEWGLRAHDAIAVLLVDLAPWRAWLPEAESIVDQAQAERVRRRRIQNQREELLLGYALHRLALGEVLQQDAEVVKLRRDPLGRPWIDGSAIQTSLSHANGYLALAVTARGAVGVDIECSERAAEMPEIASLVCHRSDAETIDAGLPSAGLRLLKLWVRKEALLKAAGVGLTRAMVDFPAPEGVSLPLSSIPGELTRLQMLDARPYCVAAVAGPPGIEIDCAWLAGPGQSAAIRATAGSGLRKGGNRARSAS